MNWTPNKTLGMVFTVLYIVVAYPLAALLSIHGPDLMGYFATGILIIGIVVLWCVYYLVESLNFTQRTLVFGLSGLGIGGVLVGTIIASWGPLLALDDYRSEKRAAGTEVSAMKDETLFSPQGNPVGIRFTYSMRFPDNNYFWHSPYVSPEEYLGVSVWTDMRTANRTIDPPMIGTDPLRYERGKTYHFTVDMVPYFVIRNADKTTSCILKPPEEYAEAFQKVIASDEEVHFNITIAGTNFRGVTANAYSPKLFYDSAIKEGALECMSPYKR